MLAPRTGMRSLRRKVGSRLRLVVDLASIGDGPLATAKIVALTLIMPIKKLGLWSRDKRFKLRFSALGQSFRFVVSDSSELEVLAEVFCRSEYPVSHLPPPRVVVDLGSNSGASLLYFHFLFPEARIYGVEPDPRTFAKLSQNVGHIDAIEIHQLAVTDTDGDALLFASPESWCSSLSRTIPSQTPIRVSARTLDTLFDDLGLEEVDLLKVDVEGAEFEIFRSARQLWKVKAIVGELHSHVLKVPPSTFFSLLEGFEVRSQEDRAFQAVRPPVSPDSRGQPASPL